MAESVGLRDDDVDDKDSKKRRRHADHHVDETGANLLIGLMFHRNQFVLTTVLTA